MENLKIILSKKISNHNLFNNVERYVHIIRDDRKNESIILECVIQYFKDGIDVSKSFSSTPVFLTADNYRRKTLYEADGITPKLEEYQEQELVEGVPQFNEDNTPKMITLSREKTIGLYDYFKKLMALPISTNSQYNTTIEMNDAIGRFNI